MDKTKSKKKYDGVSVLERRFTVTKLFCYCKHHDGYQLFDLIIGVAETKLGCVSCFCREQGRPEPPRPILPPLPSQLRAATAQALFRKTEAENLRRWKRSGAPRRWVEEHGGRWNHRDWLSLVATLVGMESEYRPINLDRVGKALEKEKLKYWEETATP